MTSNIIFCANPKCRNLCSHPYQTKVHLERDIAHFNLAFRFVKECGQRESTGSLAQVAKVGSGSHIAVHAAITERPQSGVKLKQRARKPTFGL